jgi:hypothetical protein
VVCFLARGQARAREAWEPAAPGPSLSKSVSFPMRLACCRGDRLRCDDAVNAILPSGFRQMVATSSLAPPKQNRRHRAQHPNVATLTPQYEAALRSSQQSGGIGHSRTWNTPRRPAKSASTASSRVISRRSAKAGRGSAKAPPTTQVLCGNRCCRGPSTPTPDSPRYSTAPERAAIIGTRCFARSYVERL